MIIKEFKSPNFSKISRENRNIKLIVIHYTGMQSRIESIRRLNNKKSKVSCHYLIDRKGKILRMVDDNKIAWHAGKSKWKNFKNINKVSLGIELVNKGHKFGYQSFSNLQIKNLINLTKLLKRKYKIINSNIIGHSDIAPFRKLDPGEKFPWKKLYKNKIGIWHQKEKLSNNIIDRKFIKKKFFSNLYKIGYRYFDVRVRNKKDVLLIKAFQRHFYPKKVDGKIDPKTYIISHLLAKRNKI